MTFADLLKRPIAVAIVTLAFALGGIIFVTRLPIKLYPSTSKTRISVRIPHPSFTAEVFERDYGQTLHEALSSVDGIDESEIYFNNGVSRILVWFDWNVPGNDARSRVATAIGQVQSRLPEESKNLSVRFWAGRSSGFYSVAAYSTEASSSEVYKIIEPKIKSKLNNLKNVDMARINPVEETRAEIILDQLSLARFGLAPDDVANAVKDGYRDLSLGSFKSGRSAYSVSISRNIKNFEDIAKIVIKNVENTSILLGDVADVKIFSGLPRRLYSVNGKSAVIIFAMPNQDGNIRSLAAEINSIISEAQKSIPSHIHFQTLVDPGEYINSSIVNVIFSGLTGGILAIIITFLFLGDFRNTLLIAVSIPLSLIISFIFLYWFNVTINLISLSGLMLAVGMIVDSSIVVVENIFRHLKTNESRLSRLETIAHAVTEVRGAIIASTLTTIVVFLPISFTSPLTAAVLGDLSMSVIFVIICSTAVALLVIPSLAMMVFSGEKVKKVPHSFLIKTQDFLKKIIDSYKRVLTFLLGSRKRALFVVSLPLVFLVVLLFVLSPRIKREIMAKPDSSVVTLNFSNSLTTTQEELLAAIKELEDRILKNYEGQIDNLFAQISGTADGEFTLTLKSTDLREAAMQTLPHYFRSDKTWTFEIERWNPAELPLPKIDDLKISFFGPDPKSVIILMQKAFDLLRNSDLYADIHSKPKVDFSKYLVLDPKTQVINQLPPYTLQKLANIGRIAITGRDVIEMIYKDEAMDIAINYPKETLKEPGDVLNIMIPTSYGPVPLNHFFDVKTGTGISEIAYLNSDRIFTLSASMKETTPKWAREDLENKVKELLAKNLELPDGYLYQFEDTQTDINSSIYSLLSALGISIALIYVVLAAQFNSLSAPVVIMFSVPLGLVGVIFSLYIFGSTLSLNSMLGSILLGGIGVNNSILIYDFYQRIQKDYGDKREAIVEACGMRIIPICITSLTTILGMLPIAFAIGDGTNVMQPLGIAIAGGLGAATFLTLFVVPCLLVIMGRSPTPPVE